MSAKLGPALDALVAAGANQMNGISFSTSQNPRRCWTRRAPRPSPMPAHRAETYAKAAGVSLGPILSISEGGARRRPGPMYRMAAAMAAPPAPVAAGEQSVSADVTMVWEIH